MHGPRLPERDCALVREQLDAIARCEAILAELVYGRLFEKSPAARELFGKRSLPTQRQMLTDTLAAVLDLLEDEGFTSGDLEGLGSKHRHAYGVDEGMYGAWADSVVEGIADALGPSFTAEHARAFRHALECTHATMLAGAYPDGKGGLRSRTS